MMKKTKFMFLLVLALVIVMMLAGTGAAESIKVNLNGSPLAFDQPPIIENGRTLVPMRAIFEGLGAQVGWDGASGTVTGTQDGLVVVLKIGDTQALVNGNPVILDVPAKILGGRTLVPLRFIAESMGAKVDWDGRTSTVSIARTPPSGELPAGPVPEPEKPALPGSSLINNLKFSSKLNYHFVELSDGRVYELMAPEKRFQPSVVMPSRLYPTPAKVLQYNQINTVPPPATVDHRAHQTSIKDQGERNTCVTFSVLAGMEAAYKRLDPVKYKDLNLSEQYGNYLQKMAHLRADATGPQRRENQLGRWGGGSVLYSMALLTRLYGIPEETLLPYIPDKSYQNTNEPGDNPRIDYHDNSVTQRQINDINLEAPDYSRQAVQGAKYAIRSFAFLPENQLNDPKYFEQVLAAGYDIAFGMSIMIPDPTPGNNIWNPGNIDNGSHAMLMVGYDTQREVFIVKNSWAFDNLREAGHTLVGYDYIRGGHVYEAAYITAVVHPTDGAYRREQLFLGRWKLNHDGWKGTLDIYRLPGFYQADFLTESTFGNNDYRIGTYYHQDGSAYRVNGKISGHKIEFWIDFGKPNLAYADLTGKKFTGHLFTRDADYFSGTFLDGTDNYGFYATRNDYLVSAPSPGGEIQDSQFIGAWALNHDGWPGTLTITAVDILTGRLTASYKNNQGQVFPVSGSLLPTKRGVAFSIHFDPAKPQGFFGYIYSWDRGIMSGTTVWDGTGFGWVAERHNITINIPIFPSYPIRIN